eukprot:TRINITY_DN246_c11_g1_i1.p1 TRINITY_DN246_c11_g1~~TRINITY_DN246_c11_g1_i1.p1  ORF type:complete len:1228 (-),score=492.18 TRINITY_DN246_c11_g1_i1:74-3757(-)
MGVPKLYRWLVRRYPLLTKNVTQAPTSDFDNLYLDFNSIVHNCAHSSDDSITLKSEKEIISNVFNYIEILFGIVQPKKLLYISVDGVAPRAKMNQQRQRRFRYSERREQQIAAMKQEGQSTENLFDSNCITPGTEFMQKLTEHLRFFVDRKVSTDRKWKDIQVIVSGSQVPGEGEHKIAEYIRKAKTKADYDPATSHCLYGLDADLIMLALATHEPYFTLIREEVSGKTRKNERTPTNFEFLSISLLREYLQLEFSGISSEVPFDLERFIDDFVFLCFFVGNDFIPCLPYLEIDDNGLNTLLDIYRRLFPIWKGYLVQAESGKIKLDALISYFQAIAASETKQLIQAVRFEERQKALEKPEENSQVESVKQVKKEVEKKPEPVKQEAKAWGKAALSSSTEKVQVEELPKKEIEPKKEVEPKKDETPVSTSTNQDVNLGASNLLKAILKIGPQPTQEEISTEFIKSLTLSTSTPQVEISVLSPDDAVAVAALKLKFYCLRLGKEASEINNAKFQRDFQEQYIRGLIWTLHYYYHGHVSWSWYFPYFSAPFSGDLALTPVDLKITWELGKPASPFQQLLSVLPPVSANLLPEPYRKLMEISSEIGDYFPAKFELLKDPKGREHRDIALIPFVDEKRIVDAMSKIPQSSLTDREKARNRFESNTVTTKSEKETQSQPTEIFQEFPGISRAKTENHAAPELYSDFVPRPPKNFSFGQFGLPAKQFPTMKTFTIRSSVKMVPRNLSRSFARNENPSKQAKDETRVIQVKPWEFKGNPEEIVKNFLGKEVLYHWPYLTPGKVVEISNKTTTWRLGQGPRKNANFQNDSTYVRLKFLEQYGVELGEISMIFIVVPADGSSDISEEVPPQALILRSDMLTAVKQMSTFNLKSNLKNPNRGDNVVYIGPSKKHYGSVGKISEISENFQVELKLISAEQRNVLGTEESGKWTSSAAVSKILNCDPAALGRITGSALFAPGEIELGLGIKISGRDMMAPGYARRVDSDGKKFWEYSQKTIDLLMEYKSKFPQIFMEISADSKLPVFDGSDLPINEVQAWISSHGLLNPMLVPCDTATLSLNTIRSAEEKIPNASTASETIQAAPSDVVPCSNVETSFQGHSSKYQPGDRVVYVSDAGSVPIGTIGTCISVCRDITEVMWDTPILSGTTFNGVCKSGRVSSVATNTLINLTHPIHVHTTMAQAKKEKKKEASIAAIQADKKKSAPKVQGNTFALLGEED